MSSLATPVRTDLVISMTLAEIFLLLLFVVWYGFSSIINQDPLARLRDRVAQLETENEQLVRNIKEAKETLTDLEWRLDYWRKRYPGEKESRSPGSGKRDGRSNPTCDPDNNVLIEASVVRGQASMKVLAASERLSKWIASSGHHYPTPGVSIMERAAIQQFLEDVRSYYDTAKVEGKECRFDYRLKYESKEDYFDGRELFERFLYPAGMKRVVAVSPVQ